MYVMAEICFALECTGTVWVFVYLLLKQIFLIHLFAISILSTYSLQCINHIFIICIYYKVK